MPPPHWNKRSGRGRDLRGQEMSPPYWNNRSERGRTLRDQEWAATPAWGGFRKRRTGFAGPRRQHPRAVTRPFSQPSFKPFIRDREFKRNYPLKESTVDLSGGGVGTKLYISNLDYQIKFGDIEGLFSQVGKLKRCKVHYDRTGQPSGSAEVVYERKADAIEACKQFNCFLLAGRTMKVNIVGTDLGLTIERRIRVVGDATQIPQRTVVMPYNFSGDGAPLYNGALRRFKHGDVQPKWMQRDERIRYHGRRQEAFDISEDDFETGFENLHAEAMYF